MKEKAAAKNYTRVDNERQKKQLDKLEEIKSTE